MNVTVFSEHGKAHRDNPDVLRQHPAGIHETLKALFSGAGFDTTAVYQDDGDDGSMLDGVRRRRKRQRKRRWL